MSHQEVEGTSNKTTGNQTPQDPPPWEQIMENYSYQTHNPPAFHKLPSVCCRNPPNSKKTTAISKYVSYTNMHKNYLNYSQSDKTGQFHFHTEIDPNHHASTSSSFEVRLGKSEHERGLGKKQLEEDKQSSHPEKLRSLLLYGIPHKMKAPVIHTNSHTGIGLDHSASLPSKMRSIGGQPTLETDPHVIPQRDLGSSEQYEVGLEESVGNQTGNPADKEYPNSKENTEYSLPTTSTSKNKTSADLPRNSSSHLDTKCSADVIPKTIEPHNKGIVEPPKLPTNRQIINLFLKRKFNANGTKDPISSLNASSEDAAPLAKEPKLKAVQDPLPCEEIKKQPDLPKVWIIKYVCGDSNESNNKNHKNECTSHLGTLKPNCDQSIVVLPHTENMENTPAPIDNLPKTSKCFTGAKCHPFSNHSSAIQNQITSQLGTNEATYNKEPTQLPTGNPPQVLEPLVKPVLAPKSHLLTDMLKKPTPNLDGSISTQPKISSSGDIDSHKSDKLEFDEIDAAVGLLFLKHGYLSIKHRNSAIGEVGEQEVPAQEQLTSKHINKFEAPNGNFFQ